VATSGRVPSPAKERTSRYDDQQRLTPHVWSVATMTSSNLSWHDRSKTPSNASWDAPLDTPPEARHQTLRPKRPT